MGDKDTDNQAFWPPTPKKAKPSYAGWKDNPGTLEFTFRFTEGIISSLADGPFAS
jgi:hypothetical protein